ncbi:MAG TPA: helix-turn-helix domain-containing protein [Chloroflexota bacterium]|nr:helix-turn-helix domain-containing protein [Chloroflexota bacterium]
MAEPSPAVLSPEWIAIGRACQMLGVNPATLRHWTSTGKVHVYRTPGGHRRFSAAEIASLVRTEESPSVESLPHAIIAQLRGRYRGLAHASAVHPGWLEALDPATRSRFHSLGDELLERLGEYLSARGPRQRQRALSAGWKIAAQYGQVAREAGLDTHQAIEAYLLFRRPLLDVLARSVSSHPQLSGQLARIVRDAERFMDEVLSGVAGTRPSAGGAAQ